MLVLKLEQGRLAQCGVSGVATSLCQRASTSGLRGQGRKTSAALAAAAAAGKVCNGVLLLRTKCRHLGCKLGCRCSERRIMSAWRVPAAELALNCASEVLIKGLHLQHRPGLTRQGTE